MGKLDGDVLSDLRMRDAMARVIEVLTALLAEDTDLVLSLIREAVELPPTEQFSVFMAMSQMSVALMDVLEDASGAPARQAVRELGLMLLGPAPAPDYL